MFSVMPAMYLLLLQSNENSSLKLIAWLIKLNTVAKNSIISAAAHDYFEFSQSTEWMWEGPAARVSRGQNTHICCRYFVTIHEICICDKVRTEIPEIWSHRPVLGSHTPEQRKETLRNWGKCFSDNMSQKYLSTKISMQYIAFSLSEEAPLEFSRKRNSRRLWMLAECIVHKW